MMLANASRTASWPALAAFSMGDRDQFTVTPQKIPEVLLITAQRAADYRGTLMETYRAEDFTALGLPTFVQENATRSHGRGTIRGLHFQRPPFSQAKLVRPIRGSILDVAVDLRRGSNTYGHVVTVTMSAASAEMLFIPAGFAHGYCSLQDDTEVAYKCDAYYAPGAEAGVNFADPALGIEWPFPPNEMVVAERDAALPRLADLGSPFALAG